MRFQNGEAWWTPAVGRKNSSITRPYASVNDRCDESPANTRSNAPRGTGYILLAAWGSLMAESGGDPMQKHIYQECDCLVGMLSIPIQQLALPKRSDCSYKHHCQLFGIKARKALYLVEISRRRWQSSG